jgi:hypothetical protein
MHAPLPRYLPSGPPLPPLCHDSITLHRCFSPPPLHALRHPDSDRPRGHRTNIGGRGSDRARSSAAYGHHPTSNQTPSLLHRLAARRSPWTPPSSLTKSSAACHRRRPTTIVGASTSIRCASSSSPLPSPPSHHPVFLSSSLSRLCRLVVCSQGGDAGHQSLMCPNRNRVNNHCRRPILQSLPSLHPALDQECCPSHLI